MNTPSPEAVVRHVIRLMGGHKKAFEAFDADFHTITKRWEQDTTVIGRILRAHLFVEHFLTEYLQSRNPELGSLEEARASFTQKLALVGNGTPGTGYLLPGIRRLNGIRNRIAHTLHAEVTDEDVRVFLAIDLFRAMREEKARRRSDTPSMEPIVVLEDFAIHAGISLHASATRESDIWSEAIHAALEECSGKSSTDHQHVANDTTCSTIEPKP